MPCSSIVYKVILFVIPLWFYKLKEFSIMVPLINTFVLHLKMPEDVSIDF